LPELCERLSSRLELLASGRRDAPERHRTLRDTIAWSYDLLTPAEQRLFRRLAIFAGSYTAEAAAAICGEAGDDEAGDHKASDDDSASAAESTLAGLASLVEKSLLQAKTDPDGSRFSMLETIREYALECLRASGEAEVLGHRHATYYARLAGELAWVGPGQDARDRQVERELPNTRAALAWALGQREPGIGLRLAVALGRFWYSRGAFDEGDHWLSEFLALDGLDASASGHRSQPAVRVMALYFRTLYALDRHHFDQAEALAREGLELARTDGDEARMGDMLVELGHVAEARGDLDAAMALYQESLAHMRTGEGKGAVGRVLSSIGNLARAQGNYEQARDYLEQSLAWARARHFSWAIASGLVSLGHVACEQGDFAGAVPLYRESLDLYRTMRNPAALAWCLEGVAVTLAAAGEYTHTAHTCGAVAGLRRAARSASTADWAPFAQAQDAARQALGEKEFTHASRSGVALSAERAISYALAATAGITEKYG
jgi:non-specific serine/threonine protein kinase